MCGIFGVVTGKSGAAKTVYEGLERLEYRGYDSAGLSSLDGGRIATVKESGRVCGLKEDAEKLSGNVAVGHTRWATHGAPTDNNAHPHVSGAISVVHNGIIENFKELKAEYFPNGAEFKSETDSEVVAKLIDFYYKGDLLSAVAQTVKRLKGSYALGVMCAEFEGIVAVKYKSPVVVGFAEEGCYICSDIPALPETVTSVCVPEDGDIVVIQKSSVKFLNGDLKAVTRVRQSICAGQFAGGKGSYPHFMIKEINENERSVKETCDAFFRNVDAKKLSTFIKNADKILITGCGTAYNAALAGKHFFQLTGLDCTVEIASELRYAQVKVTSKTLVFAVSQSGETADTVEAVQALKNDGAKIVAVTNCGFSAITRVAHLVVPICAGAEVCVAATKSYLGQVCALYLAANLKNDVFDARTKILQASEKIAGVLKSGDSAEKIAAECAKSSATFFLGRGLDYAVAVEAALKLKEVSYVFSDGYPAGELKHGTLALVDEKTVSVVIICDEKIAEKCVNAVSQVRSRGGKVMVITCLDSVAKELEKEVFVWKLPQCEADLSLMLSATAVQLIAYRAAVCLNRDPDKPRNLAKSVTVE